MRRKRAPHFNLRAHQKCTGLKWQLDDFITQYLYPLLPNASVLFFSLLLPSMQPRPSRPNLRFIVSVIHSSHCTLHFNTSIQNSHGLMKFFFNLLFSSTHLIVRTISIFILYDMICVLFDNITIGISIYLPTLILYYR